MRWRHQDEEKRNIPKPPTQTPHLGTSASCPHSPQSRPSWYETGPAPRSRRGASHSCPRARRPPAPPRGSAARAPAAGGRGLGLAPAAASGHPASASACWRRLCYSRAAAQAWSACSCTGSPRTRSAYRLAWIRRTGDESDEWVLLGDTARLGFVENAMAGKHGMR